jgi:hypothetical protein
VAPLCRLVGVAGALLGLQSTTTEGTSHGLVFGKRIRVGENETVDLSKRRASVAQRRVTVNSRGRGSIRILPGLSVRFRRRWLPA